MQKYQLKAMGTMVGQLSNPCDATFQVDDMYRLDKAYS